MRQTSRKTTGLKTVSDELLVYFQEGSGDAVEFFWREILRRGLGFVRENKMLKILKRRKIANDSEYNFVTDVIVAYRQQGLINEEQRDLLNQYIANYEMRFKNLR